ncbi:MAG TPA: choice-of-anchor tandem repeat GloVer-containing protein [Capsulimonadaceae bacterium]|jgi:uncharacterized repeat protein (TIGR03803 family)
MRYTISSLRSSFVLICVLFLVALGSDSRAYSASVTYSVIHSFAGATDGSAPASRLFVAPDGTFFGTAPYGGASGYGSVFHMKPTGEGALVYSFGAGATGALPHAPVILASDGNLYGTTFYTGANNNGTVYKLTPLGVLTTLYSFAGVADGSFPETELIEGADGNFYGTTSNGAGYSGGSVFKITPAGVLTTLHKFTNGADGGHPLGGLALGADGNYYGTASISNGTSGFGVIYKITPAGDFTTLYTFLGGNDGAGPRGTLLRASDGAFYGSTFYGGANGAGTLFKITADGTYTSLYSFTGLTDGANPDGRLVEGSDGLLYGSTTGGGVSNKGTLFRASTVGDLASLYSFTGGADGGLPRGGLVQGPDKRFFGTTVQGGASAKGVVFSLDVGLGTPAISALSPAGVPVGKPDFTLYVAGAGFSAVSLVTFGGVALTTTYVNPTTLTAAVPASLVTTAGLPVVTVTNASAGGGTSPGATFTVYNPTPAITQVSPVTTPRGSPGFKLTVAGTGFIADSQISVANYPVPTTHNADGTLSVDLPASITANAAYFAVTVVNPGPGGGASKPAAFAITNPLPTITSVSPTSGILGSAVPITITGTNYVGDSRIFVDGSAVATVVVSSTQLTTTLSATLATGAHTLTVVSPSPGGGTSNGVSYGVKYPVAVINSLKPQTAPAGSPDIALTVAGAGFVPGSQISFAGVLLTTTLNADHTLSATIPAASLAVGGSKPVVVINPAPGGGSSVAVPFYVTIAAPTITAISPNPGTYGAAYPLTVTGTNFVPESVVNVGGVAYPTKLNIDGALVVTIPATLPNGKYPVTVTNPAPGGGTSASVLLYQINPLPVISKLYPTSAPAGSADLPIFVYGTGFVPGLSQIVFGDLALPATLYAPGVWTATVPASALAKGRIVQVALRNPALGGGTSATLPFNVTFGAPTITSISPNPGTFGAAYPLIVTGTNFVPESVVNVGGVAYPTKPNIDGALVVTIPATLANGKYAVTVTNPAPGGGTSASVLLYQINPLPVISKLYPVSAPAGSADLALFVYGTGFVPGLSQIVFGDLALPATLYAPGVWKAIVPASALAKGRIVQVALRNPALGGGTSASLPFNITFFAPTITSISPNPGTYGAAYPLTVTGTNFVPESVVNVGGVAYQTKLNVDGALVVTIPATLPNGKYTVTVTNPAPGGGTSASVMFYQINPLPVISKLYPVSAPVGSADLALFVYGTGFVPGLSQIVFGDLALPATLYAPGVWKAIVPASALAKGRIVQVALRNPALGGGTSAALPFNVTLFAPTITSISPNPGTYGAAYPLTVTGTNFVPESVVNIGGVAYPTKLNVDGALVVTIPATLANGKYPVTVTNPAPGGGTSASVMFYQINPLPVISKLYPTSVPAGSADLPIFVYGTGFVPGLSQIVFGDLVLPATLYAPGVWTATVPASALAKGRIVQVALRNPALGGGTSATLPFNVTFAVPTITAISPNPGTAGVAYPLTVTGTNFLPESVVNVGGVAYPTKLNADGTLGVVIPATLLSGKYAVTVSNPAPGGGTSASVLLYHVNPVPVITKLAQATATAGSGDFAFYVYGTGFAPGASKIMFGALALPATLNVNGLWTATVPASALAKPGVVQVALSNPALGGGTSAALPFYIVAPVPVINSLSPSTGVAGVATPVTLAGAGFIGVSVVSVGGTALATVLNADGTLSATIPAQVAGSYPVTVVNPAPGGGASGATAFVVN